MSHQKMDSETQDLVTSGIRLGILEGERRAKQDVQELINTLIKANNDFVTTNKQLRDLLILTDKAYPLDVVEINLPLAEEILRVLRNRNKTLTGQLIDAIDRTQKRLAEETAQMEEMLAEVAGEK